MSASPPRAVVLVLAALPLLGLAAVTAVHGVQGEVLDYDELWHLASGRAIAEAGAVPSIDPFTHTAGETPWVNTNWLAQRVLWALYRAAGFEACWLLGVALLVGTVALAHARAARRSGASPWAALPVDLFVLASLLTGSTVRPQGWSFLLLALALLLADALRDRRARGESLALGTALGTVLALSVQLHGAHVFVSGAVALVLLSELWDLARAAPDASGARAAALALALALGALSVLVHPQGVEVLLHPLRYASPELREIHEVVQELRPPDFSTLDGQVVEAALLLLLALAVVGRAAWRTEDLVLALAFGHLAVRHARGLHYFAIAVAGPLANALSGALVPPRGPAPVRAVLSLLERLAPSARAFSRALPAALGASFLAVAAASVPRLSPGIPGDLSSPRLAPHADVADVASFLAAWDPPRELWNEPEQGGALIFRLWPGRRVFIDGRGDLHARSGAFHDYLVVWDVREGFEAVLNRRGCDVCVVTKEREGAPTSRLLPALLDVGWTIAYENRTVALVVRPGSRAERTLRRR